MQNFDLYKFGFDNFRPSDGCNFALQKLKSCTEDTCFLISGVQYYIPIKLCKTAGSIHLFKIMGMLKPENIKIKKKLYLGYFGNRLERKSL